MLTLAGGASLMPPMDMNWPPEVVTRFEYTYPWNWRTPYCLTIDDGWTGGNIEPFLIYLANENLIDFTWFANGTGIRRIRESDTAMRIVRERGVEVGYHTMHHPSVVDQRRNYNRDRWIADYEEWSEIAKETYEGLEYLVRPYARAAGGYFSDAFMEMCEEKGLTAYGWSKDPYVLARGEKIERGDIFLTHFRYSEWKWLQHIRDLRYNDLMIPTSIEGMIMGEIVNKQIQYALWKGLMP
jgi:peptidoglycan/xylan/chitin deacetylase (PgdA/CDA1 family)